MYKLFFNNLAFEKYIEENNFEIVDEAILTDFMKTNAATEEFPKHKKVGGISAYIYPQFYVNTLLGTEKRGLQAIVNQTLYDMNDIPIELRNYALKVYEVLKKS